MKRRPNVSTNRHWISNQLFFSIEDLPEETWISINHFKGLTLSGTYQVSDKGRVKTLSGEIMVGSISEDGYHIVSLQCCRQGGSTKSLMVPVHRLILIAFKGDPPDGMLNPTVQHINKNKLDNRIKNLCWMTAFENNQDGHGTRVKIVDSIGEHFFNSQKVASSYIGRHEDYISECIHNRYQLTDAKGNLVKLFTEIDGQWVEYVRHHPYNCNKCKLYVDGQILEFKSFKECDRFLNKPESYTSARIHNNWPILEDKPHSFYTFDYAQDKYIEYCPTAKRKKNFANKCEVKLSDSDSFVSFQSISAAARYINRDPEYLRIAVKSGKTIKDGNGNVIEVRLIK